MIPDERRYSEKWFYQCIQSRYGFNPHHLRLADGCEFFIGQGCKVGLGGHLMGQKVTDQVAEMRSLPAGIDQRSPARHPDWLGPDDLALKIQEIREATNGEIPIQLKLGAARVYDDVRMAAKTDPDAGRRGLSLFLVDAKTPGLTIRPMDPLGSRTSLPNEVFFDDVTIPIENLLGTEGGAWPMLMRGLNQERLLLAATSAGQGWRSH